MIDINRNLADSHSIPLVWYVTHIKIVSLALGKIRLFSVGLYIDCLDHFPNLFVEVLPKFVVLCPNAHNEFVLMIVLYVIANSVPH